MRNWLRDLRVKSNFTQKDVAERVNLDVTAISKYELGERRPSYETAKRVASLLGFNWTRFFEDEETVGQVQTGT